MKKGFLLFFAAIAIAVCGCSQITNPIKGNAVIDWVDFVKLNGKTFYRLYNHVISDPNLVTDQVAGKVKFKIADAVTNPKYKTKDGDAAFLTEGTRLFQVEGFSSDEVIAARDEQEIGGYRLYAEVELMETIRHHYKDLPKDQVEQIQLFEHGEVKPFLTLTGEGIAQFISLLDNGKDVSNYIPDQTNGDPVYYNMVFYIEGPFAYIYSLADDGKNVFFHPWETRIVDAEIRKFIEHNNSRLEAID